MPSFVGGGGGAGGEGGMMRDLGEEGEEGERDWVSFWKVGGGGDGGGSCWEELELELELEFFTRGFLVFLLGVRVRVWRFPYHIPCTKVAVIMK